MSQADFQARILAIAASIAERVLDTSLEDFLNRRFPADGDDFQALTKTCLEGISEGWLCQHEHAGISYGRVLKPTAESRNFSVDVVLMEDLAGPHHRHPNGEIDMIMPTSTNARFDDRGAGWLVYPPNSAHWPTVSGGRAIVLYLLPDGAIEFTGK